MCVAVSNLKGEKAKASMSRFRNVQPFVSFLGTPLAQNTSLLKKKERKGHGGGLKVVSLGPTVPNLAGSSRLFSAVRLMSLLYGGLIGFIAIQE